ncbi:cyclodeaminase/cyclohydrolase family protein [Pseudarthrobacter sp. NPDC080039]|uniref:cyclodeaminase/cyclohydrolase family protein n=1 Tax=unclassified Pseudarthrobacter TaxID=2647000 RepID=UPI00344F67AC
MDKAEVTTQGSTVEEWTRALAESTGSPGGGAGTGVMLAVAASLTSMVAGYSGDDGGEPAKIRARAQQLRREALHLADEDASASKAFGAAFRLEPGDGRDQAIRRASLEAAASSAVLGDRAIGAIDDLAWLATNGNRALVADIVVAFGALRAAVAGARTNVSFDLGSLRSAGATLEQVRTQQPDLWAAVEKLGGAMDRIDELTAAIDDRAAPTEAG